MRLLKWDGCFSVTMAPSGSISYLYPVPLRDRKKLQQEHNGWTSLQCKIKKSTLEFPSGFPFNPFSTIPTK